jgi:sugar phosphate isomerase/epimerase
MFPFRLGAPSYILPDAIIPNIRFLGPHIDEVELVLFESESEYSLPSPAEIEEMRHLAAQFKLVYNVHLPTDAFLADADPRSRDLFRQRVLQFIERTSPLDPTVFILHCESSSADVRKSTDLNAWMDLVGESFEKLVHDGVDPHRIALENLEYAPETLLPLAERFGMSLCLDIGHLLRYGHSLCGRLRPLLEKSSMVHLHGVRHGRDHLGIHRIAEQAWNLIRQALDESFTGGVSLEVFSLEELVPSLDRIQTLLRPVESPRSAGPKPGSAT